MSMRTVLLYPALKYHIYLNAIRQHRNLYLRCVKTSSFPSLSFTNALRYSVDSPAKCWNCNFKYKSDLFCSKCKVLQEPPTNVTYFDLIGVPKDYNITITEIHDKYRSLQKLLHPDKFGNKSEKEKQLSENLSSLVNKAYSTLLNPLQRGLYLLELNNITISDETENLNAEFLMEIMEKNEEIDGAGNDKEKIIKLMQQNEIVFNKLLKEVADAFDSKDMKKAEATLKRMKYYDSMNNRLKKLKHDLGIVD